MREYILQYFMIGHLETNMGEKQKEKYQVKFEYCFWLRTNKKYRRIRSLFVGPLGSRNVLTGGI